MKRLDAFARRLDGFSEAVGAGVSWLTTLLVLLVCFDVFTRYLVNYSLVWVQELEWHLFALIFLLGAGYTLKHDKHVRVDILYMKRGPRAQAWINLLGCLLFLFPFCCAVIWASFAFVGDSFGDGEGSPNPGGLPARYVLKACIPIAFFLLMLQGLSLSVRSLVTIHGDKSETTGA